MTSTHLHIEHRDAVAVVRLTRPLAPPCRRPLPLHWKRTVSALITRAACGSSAAAAASG